MASESLSFDIFANDRASETFRRLGVAASNASGDVKKLGDRLDKLGTRVSTARVGLKGNKEAGADLDKLDVKLIRLGNKVADPNITVEGKIKALAEISAVDLAMDRLNKKFARPNLLARGLTGASKAGALAPSGLGVAAALSPALIPLAAGIAAGIGAIGVSLSAAAIGAGAFGLLAKSALTTAGTAATAVEKAQQTYNAAIATGTKHATAYAAEQRAIKLAYAGLSPAQIALSKQVGDMQNAWDKVKASIAPLMSTALLPWLDAVTRAMKFIKPFIAPIAALFDSLGRSLDAAFANNAPKIRDMAKAFGQFAASQLNDVARFIMDIAQGVFQLGKDLAANGANFGAAGGWLAGMGDGFLTWSKSAAARKDVQGFMKFLHDEGPVVKGILADLGKILPGIFKGATTTGTLELNALAGFLGLIAGLPKGWQAPLTEAAGALLLLSKTGVVRVGLKLTGKLAEHPTAFGFSIGTLLAAGIIDAVNQKRPGAGGKTWWQSFGPPPKAQQDNWLNSWSGLGNRIVQIADDVRHGVSQAWDFLWNHTLASTKQGNHQIAGEFDKFRHNTAATFDSIRHNAAVEWDTIWRNTVTRVQNGVGDVVAWFRKLPGRALGALQGLGTALYNFGHMMFIKFWNGMKAAWSFIASWVSRIAGWIKDLKGPIGKDRNLLYDEGHAIMQGLGRGIRHGFNSYVSQQLRNVGAGVKRWAGLVSQALRMEGLSPSLLGNVLYQIQTESGGNPNAINLNDTNAQMGDPSRGLLQTIGSTFLAYHWPGTSNNIYDPFANIAAALNYARHVYGPSLMSGGMGIGSGHGYAAGSWQVPFTGPATVHKGEMIIPARTAAAIRSGGGGNTYVTVNVQVGHGTHPVAAAQEIVKVLNTGAMSGVKLRTSILGPG